MRERECWHQATPVSDVCVCVCERERERELAPGASGVGRLSVNGSMRGKEAVKVLLILAFLCLFLLVALLFLFLSCPIALFSLY